MAEPIETPSNLLEEPSAASVVFDSVKESLADLCAKGRVQYAHKNYEQAADLYSRATELQAELNGEMCPDNAEILFLYGRSLFKLGQSKSDVLGGTNGQKKISKSSKPVNINELDEPEQTEETEESKPSSDVIPSNESAQNKTSTLEESQPSFDASSPTSTAQIDRSENKETDTNDHNSISASKDQNNISAARESKPTPNDRAPVDVKEDISLTLTSKTTIDAKKPLFQFTGDENFEASEEVEEDEAENEEDEAEEDDLASAFAVLDLARILFEKRLKELNGDDDKGKVAGDSLMVKHYKERLADTHDLLAEISLENERFPAAVTDCKAALIYKQELYTEERSIIAEAHFKLSLALEFASITRPADEKNESNEAAIEIDQTLRDEAVKEMEAAIKSTDLKLQSKEAELSKSQSPDDIETTRNQITEVKEMLSELQSRLEELKSSTVDVKSALYGPLMGKNGILNANALEESPNEKAARIEEAKKMAFDVTDLVRKKTRAEEAPAVRSPTGKRKAEDLKESEPKKARVENDGNDENNV